MSLEILFSTHILNLPENLGAVSDEHGERFHQDISTMKSRYNAKLTPNMMADYFWSLGRDIPDANIKSNPILCISRLLYTIFIIKIYY